MPPSLLDKTLAILTNQGGTLTFCGAEFIDPEYDRPYRYSVRVDLNGVETGYLETYCTKHEAAGANEWEASRVQYTANGINDVYRGRDDNFIEGLAWILGVDNS